MGIPYAPPFRRLEVDEFAARAVELREWARDRFGQVADADRRQRPRRDELIETLPVRLLQKSLLVSSYESRADFPQFRELFVLFLR